MRIFVDIGHPAHVHVLKNLLWVLQRNNHEIKITTRDKEITIYLLDHYGFNYENLGKNKKGLFNKAVGLVEFDYKLFKIARSFNPDIFVGVGSIYAAHVAALMRKPCILFDDTENSTEQYMLYAPFVTVVCTPACFKKDLGSKQIRYPGYHELTYLHPNHFTPDPDVLDRLGLSEDEKLILVRFVSWGASHDIKDKGFDKPVDIVKRLEQYGRVVITSERGLPEELIAYRMNLPPENIHHLMYYASLYIGESATMASESAILGTPAVFVSTSRRGYTDEQEENYGLVYTFSDPVQGQIQALDKAIELLSEKNLKREWARRRDIMLSERIDVTAFMVDLIEGYPDSLTQVLKKYECSVNGGLPR
ncbi:hypothetical protein ANME2D_01688 [Candidatus Methanoperedens nitroreducens]|uniref:DUF354 domain-containing protein n=1 Tax=Candidatus Methanoperedens nitratireducens TaxID=1392998 RepID=A0A062V6R4_9EURY|nr:DUF354 domain-containing protein [Candidatus Methanoperedens nitroreducens]KCZ72283.1 hypothetical protein ANME2D_01688 [Candidatus Methanoperedens nitroreducens]MDJ1420748.1 DUF354 domain-containing protein [Candidatus Methanoperedens sp.]